MFAAHLSHSQTSANMDEEVKKEGGEHLLGHMGLITRCLLPGSYMRLILKFQVQREFGSYLVQVYWPTVLTTILSWISFWMNYDSSAARVTIGKSYLHPKEKLGPSFSGKKIESKKENHAYTV